MTQYIYIMCLFHDCFSLCAVWFEPTGADKASVPIHEGVLDKIQYVSPNLSELRSIHQSLYGTQTKKMAITGIYMTIILLVIQ